ncbi:MAG: cysteine desulfurase [Bacteroidia bacterium]|nr:cysteine desulfurase [Bacteroidia bacterium]
MQTIYLDYNSTTPVDPLVLETMLPFFTEKFGNAASRTHRYGWTAEAVVEKARGQVAGMIGAEPAEIIFTSGATESLNLALRGAMEAYRSKGRHLVVCAAEHKAVLDTARDLAFSGVETSVLGVDHEGIIDLQELEKLIREDTVLVAVMQANNETGVIQDAEAIGRLCRERGTLFLSDSTQAAGKIRVDVQEQRMDLCSLSAHKLYGPKGVGALYVRRKNPRVKLLAEISGGGHEQGLRSGTLNVPGIVGFGEACQLAAERLWEYGTHTSRWRTFLEQQLTVERKHGFINGSIRSRLPNTSNLCFPGMRSEHLIKALPEIAMSMGSACTSALPQPSHVLQSMGRKDDEIFSSVRISIGKDTTEAEIREAILRIGMELDKAGLTPPAV